MRRGLGPPDLDGSVIHMHLRGVLAGRRQADRLHILAGVVHGSDFPASQERAIDFAPMILSYGDSRWPGWTSHVPNQTEENPSKLKLHTEFWFPRARSLRVPDIGPGPQAPSTSMDIHPKHWLCSKAKQLPVASPGKPVFVVRSCNSKARLRITHQSKIANPALPFPWPISWPLHQSTRATSMGALVIRRDDSFSRSMASWPGSLNMEISFLSESRLPNFAGLARWS